VVRGTSGGGGNVLKAEVKREGFVFIGTKKASASELATVCSSTLKKFFCTKVVESA
jgi:hypothetical protein